MLSRRSFLEKSALLAGASLLSIDTEAARIKKFGCQLYSVRDVISKDPRGTMTQLAQMGYNFFESFQGKQGFLWGMTGKEAKTFFGDIGVRMVSTHLDINTDFEKSIENAVEAGLEYMLCPYIGMQPSLDAWKKKAELFNQKGELCRKAGINFGYHNHSYSFQLANGAKGQKILLDETDPNLVMFELDMCWSEAAGESSAEHLRAYNGRYKLCHIKQLETITPKPKQTDLDKGIINYPPLVKVAKETGMKYFLVEQEEYPSSPMESMASNAQYMKKLRY